MTDSILERLEKALKYADLLQYSHPDVKFGKTTVSNLAVSDWTKEWNDGIRYLRKTGWVKKQSRSYLFNRLGRKDLEVIQPPVKSGEYEGGYFLSKEVADDMVVPAFAVVEKNGKRENKRVIVCVSGSSSKDEADLAMKSQEEIVTAVLPFLTACIDYAGKNGLEITFTGYSRGAMAIVSASDVLIQRCEEKNVSVNFLPMAPLPIEKNVNYQDALPMGLGSDIASDGKNLLSGNWPKYPCITFNNQDHNEKYGGDWDYEKVWDYASNASTYLSNHSLDSYTRIFKALTKNSFYQSVLSQIEPQPCKIHYANKGGSYSKKDGWVTFYADVKNLNIVMPSFLTKVVSGEGKATIYCYNNPKTEETVEFDAKDEVFIVVAGRYNEYTYIDTNSASLTFNGKLIDNKKDKGGIFKNIEGVIFKDGCLSLDPIGFEPFSENIKDRLSHCHKKFASSLIKESSTGTLIASKLQGQFK